MNSSEKKAKTTMVRPFKDLLNNSQGQTLSQARHKIARRYVGQHTIYAVEQSTECIQVRSSRYVSYNIKKKIENDASPHSVVFNVAPNPKPLSQEDEAESWLTPGRFRMRSNR